MSERKTEKIFRSLLKNNQYEDDDNGITIEEQTSEIVQIKNILSKSSKHDTGKVGKPEFIITSINNTDVLIVVECKASVKKHESKNRDNPVDFAVDGVLHYAKFLSKEYTVLAIAVSGITASTLKISNFLFPRNGNTYKELTNESEEVINEILPFNDYVRLISYDPEVERSRQDDLIDFAKDLHEFLWTTAKISEEDKPLLVSGTLIALKNESFLKSYMNYSPSELPTEWLRAIKKELDSANIPQAKKDIMHQPFVSVAISPNLGVPDTDTAKKYPKGALYEVIKKINENVWHFLSVYHNFDVVGHFYGEFLKYSGGDKKALGIVLTPRHITELFTLLANVSKKDTVLDICTGTGGFLISAMQSMFKEALTEDEKEDIRKNRLIGVENSPKMFALAASNMILRGDGKANLYQGNCFDEAISADIKKHTPTVGLLNPPYAQAKGDIDLHELKFVRRMLDQLQKGGIGVAIVPVSCATSNHIEKETILRNHTLKAVMSMPSDLFTAGVVTCIMIFEAHKSHKLSKKKTWFGYWRDDGFVKTSDKGRIDKFHKWEKIKKRWIESYRNNEVHAGESVLAYVDHNNEWIAEAYMDTDYTKLTKEKFEDVVKKYAVFKMLGEV